MIRPGPEASLSALFARVAAACLIAVGLAGCGADPEPPSLPSFDSKPHPQALAKPHYHLAVHPLHNPRRLATAYQPLIDYLNANITEANFELEASRDYAAYEAKFRAREPELLLPNPWQTLEAMKLGYRVVAMMGDREDFRGIFIVRRDSPVRQPADLKGRAVSYPAPTALAASIMPQWFLHERGVDVNRDIENRYVGSQESSIMNVYMGELAAGATWPPPWRAYQKDHPREAAQLKVLWETAPLLNNSFMIRDDLPTPLAARLQAVLVGMSGSPTGRAALEAMETARIHPAGNETYAPVREFVARFEKEVRQVEQRP